MNSIAHCAGLEAAVAISLVSACQHVLMAVQSSTTYQRRKRGLGNPPTLCSGTCQMHHPADHQARRTRKIERPVNHRSCTCNRPIKYCTLHAWIVVRDSPFEVCRSHFVRLQHQMDVHVIIAKDQAWVRRQDLLTSTSTLNDCSFAFNECTAILAVAVASGDATRAMGTSSSNDRTVLRARRHILPGLLLPILPPTLKH